MTLLPTEAAADPDEDRTGNRTHRENVLDTAEDELYGYDGLHRLTNLKRGELSNGQINNLDFHQDWSLEALGNWQTFDEDIDGDATFDLQQSREHNAANEIDDTTGDSDAITETAGTSWFDPDHDANGNMTAMPIPGDEADGYTAEYDAWNRLVKIVDDSMSNTVATYEYDGLNRRIEARVYDTSGGGSLDETRHIYYSDQWQRIEVRVDGTADADLDRQYFWGVRYVDDLIMRTRDTTGDGNINQAHFVLNDVQFNITALLTGPATVGERYRYEAYGQRTVLNAAFTEHNDPEAGSYAWRIGHQGLHHDPETRLIENRNRMRHPTLGRWLQRDAAHYIDGPNVYQYVRSNPNRFVDPTGYWGWDNNWISHGIGGLLGFHGREVASAGWNEGGRQVKRTARKAATAARGVKDGIDDLAGTAAGTIGGAFGSDEWAAHRDKSLENIKDTVIALKDVPAHLRDRIRCADSVDEVADILQDAGLTAAAAALGGKSPKLLRGRSGRAPRANGDGDSPGLTTPDRYFRDKTPAEASKALSDKYGPPRSVRPGAETYYNPRTQRSYNVHTDPDHGPPHVDIRRRGPYEDRRIPLGE